MNLREIRDVMCRLSYAWAYTNRINMVTNVSFSISARPASGKYCKVPL